MDQQFNIPKTVIQESLKDDVIYIDVRSPKEFDEYHLDGAINLPIFTNDERAEIGTLYKQSGREDAKRRGLDVFSEKIPAFYNQLRAIHESEPDKDFVVYCWRGGMRSKAVVSTMAMMELPVKQLDGGIRSYRYLVMNGLESHSRSSKKFIVLEGNTGTRKTDILRELKEQGYPVLDLEGLAEHRGSVFGGIGLVPSSQKEFEARLYHELERMQDSPYFLIEGESKRIGRVVVPDFIMDGKESGVRIHVDTSFENRVDNIMEDYQLDKHIEQFKEGIDVIEKRLKPDVKENIQYWLQTRQLKKVVASLLEHYYDPRYEHAANQYESDVYQCTFDTLDEGVEKTKALIDQILYEQKWNTGVMA